MKASELATKLMEHPDADVWEWRGELTVQGKTRYHNPGDARYDSDTNRIYL